MDGTVVYAFNDEVLEYINRYKNGDEVDWQQLAQFLEVGYKTRVIDRLGGIPKWLQKKPGDVPLTTIAEMRFFYVGKDSKYYTPTILVTLDESRRLITGSAFGGRIWLQSLPKTDSRLLIFGRPEIFYAMHTKDEEAFKLAHKETILTDIINSKDSLLSRLASAEQAKEVLRYIVNITATLGPDLVVSPTCDCGILKDSGDFAITNDLEPLQPSMLKFIPAK
jgi:hypothetical protein